MIEQIKQLINQKNQINKKLEIIIREELVKTANKLQLDRVDFEGWDGATCWKDGDYFNSDEIDILAEIYDEQLNTYLLEIWSKDAGWHDWNR